MMPLISLRRGRLTVSGPIAPRLTHHRTSSAVMPRNCDWNLPDRMSSSAPSDPAPNGVEDASPVKELPVDLNGNASDPPSARSVTEISVKLVSSQQTESAAVTADESLESSGGAASLVDEIPEVESSSDGAGGGDPSFEEFTSLPDTSELLEKLTGIRDSKRQVIDMLDELKRGSEDPDQLDKEQLVKLLSAYDGFKAQEEQYLALLEKVMVLKEAYKRTQAGLAALDDQDGEEDAEEPPPELRVASGLLAKLKVSAVTASPARSAASAASSEPEPEPIEDELDALKQQRDLLRQMITQQKTLRENQARKNQAQLAASDDLAKSLDMETASVRSLVAEQAGSIAAKKAELAELKARLAATKGITGDIIGEVSHTDSNGLLYPVAAGGEDGDATSALHAKLADLRAKRERMGELLGNLDSLEVAIDSGGPVSSVAEETDEDAVALTDALDGLNEQMGQLSSARSKLVELQTMANEICADGRPLPPDLKAAIETILDGMEASMGPMDEESTTAASDGGQTPTPPEELQALSMEQLRSRFDSSVNEQNSALNTIREEQERVNAVRARIDHINRTELNNSRDTSSRTATDDIAANPQLPSFRRNNLLGHDEPRTSNLPHSSNISQGEAGEAQSGADVQAQLQEHMNAIHRLISATGPQMQPEAQQLQQLQNQQLMMSQLINCQQQLQLQGMEMRAMQNHMADLQYRSQSAVDQAPFEGSPGQSFNAAPPQAYDGRPLSTGSLYNLLAPNPYLPFHMYNPGLLQAPMGNLVHSSEAPECAAPKKTAAVRRTQSARHPWAPVASGMNASWHPGAAGGLGGGDPRLSTSSVGRTRAFESSDSQPEPIPESAAEEVSRRMNAAAQKPPPVPKLDLKLSGKGPVGGMTESSEYLAHAARVQASASAASSRFNSPRRLPPGMNSDEFDEMREQIYSDVATLISQNEERPLFLLELFRDLQLVSSDFLRSKAVAALQDTLNRFLTDQHNSTPLRSARLTRNPYLSSTTFDITTDDGVTDDDDTTPRKVSPKPPPSSRPGHDYSEAVASTSSLSTPEAATTPTTTDDPLRNTILHRPQRTEVGETRASRTRVEIADLEKAIAGMIDELIPFLRENSTGPANDQMLAYIRKLILGLVKAKWEGVEVAALGELLDGALAKYAGKRLGSCSGELLTDVSELVFNELAFARLLRNVDSSLSLSANVARPAPAKDDGSRSARPDLAQPLLSRSEVNHHSMDSSEASGEEGLSASLRAMKATTPRLPVVEVRTAVGDAAALDSELEGLLGGPDDSFSTAPNCESRETSEEPIPELIDAVAAASRSTSVANDLDLSHEPHPDDHTDNHKTMAQIGEDV